jgi:hypothetical protein
LKVDERKSNGGLNLVAQPAYEVRVIDVALRWNKHFEIKPLGPTRKIDWPGERLLPFQGRVKQRLDPEKRFIHEVTAIFAREYWRFRHAYGRQFQIVSGT